MSPTEAISYGCCQNSADRISFNRTKNNDNLFIALHSGEIWRGEVLLYKADAAKLRDQLIELYPLNHGVQINQLIAENKVLLAANERLQQQVEDTKPVVIVPTNLSDCEAW